MNPIKQHPIAAFYVFAFAISWLGFVPQALYSYGLFPFDSPLLTVLGGLGPTLAAVIVVWTLQIKAGVRDLFLHLLIWRVGWQWYLFILLFWFVVAALALGIGTFFGQPLPAFNQFSYLMLLPIFITNLLSNVWEELGWRGFALPRLQVQHGDLYISLLMGALWGVWQLPLLLNPTSPMSTLSRYGIVVSMIAMTVILTWLYNNTKGSLLTVSMFHAMSNTMAFLMLEFGTLTSSYAYVVSITAVLAVLIIWFYGTQRFFKQSSRPAHFK